MSMQPCGEGTPAFLPGVFEGVISEQDQALWPYDRYHCSRVVLV